MHAQLTRLDWQDAANTRSYLDLYGSIFPAWEREPEATLVRRHQEGDYHTDIIKGSQGVDAFMTVQHVPAFDLCILAYIAVCTERQGEGLGSAMLKQLLATHHLDGMTPWLFIEAEYPQPCSFYLKHGLRRIDTPYAAPSYTDPRQVHPMALLVTHPSLGDEIDGAILEPKVRELLRDGYPLTDGDPRWSQCFGWGQPTHHISRSLP